MNQSSSQASNADLPTPWPDLIAVRSLAATVRSAFVCHGSGLTPSASRTNRSGSLAQSCSSIAASAASESGEYGKETSTPIRVHGWRRLAPAALQDHLGGAESLRRLRLLILHDLDDDLERCVGMLQRQGAEVVRHAAIWCERIVPAIARPS